MLAAPTRHALAEFEIDDFEHCLVVLDIEDLRIGGAVDRLEQPVQFDSGFGLERERVRFPRVDVIDISANVLDHLFRNLDRLAFDLDLGWNP